MCKFCSLQASCSKENAELQIYSMQSEIGLSRV